MIFALTATIPAIIILTIAAFIAAVVRAIDLHQRYKISFYTALKVAFKEV